MKPDKNDEYIVALLKKCASGDRQEQIKAQYDLVKALTLPLREAILYGNILGDIFEVTQLPDGAQPEYPLDLLNPGQESDFIAYTAPGNGRIPERRVEGDYVTVPTFGYANSIDWLLRYARDGRIDVMRRAMEVLVAGFVKKMNDDGWYTILGAAADRNILVYDAAATAGAFTKRLVSLAKNVMRRNAGGNSASLRRGRLTDIYLSPEAVEDIRNWNLDQVDEITRRELYLASDGGITRVFGVNLHDLDELGEGQQYQQFFTEQLGGTMAASDVEICVGLDLQASATFVMPVRESVKIFPDENMHRSQKQGLYGWGESGVAVLDNRNVILLSH